MPEPILKLERITKRFPGVLALDGVTLDVRPGEVHALVGENGAGKSTLIKCCTGAVVPDSGTISIAEKSYAQMTPKLADECGVAVIYQELNSVKDLSAAENVFLGNEIRHGIIVDKKEMERKSAEIFSQLNIKIDPNEKVKNLTVGYCQMIEIAKAMMHNARILIMDEPSAPLTNNETENMFRIVHKLKESGVAIIYITHRTNEIFQLSDRVSVMRDGKLIQTLQTAQTNADELIKLMVGRELSASFPARERAISDEVLLEVQHFVGKGVSDVSFQVHRGEVLGFGGLIGAGRTELAELIYGVRKKAKGQLFWKGRELHISCPKEAIEAGIYLCPEDRKLMGLCLPLSIRDNIALPSLTKWSRVSVIDQKTVEQTAEKYKKDLQIKTPSLQQLVKNLSGGNQQKVVLAKGLATMPELIILDEPTRGIDVGAKQEIYKLINQLIADGKTVIMITSEMEELLGMSDRIIVLAEGHFSGELQRGEFTQERIMELASKAYNKE
ncbi:MAG: sugar ABC transporter ATP-binding protein [Eubacteriales bacterium]|nr:sugar ABC transporter ATP-binding protein [Eubacteriales bacterium]